MANIASNFVIRELTGEKPRTIKLSARAMPYRGVSFPIRQRFSKKTPAGSPESTLQILGPEEGSTSINGFWKDRYIKNANDGAPSAVVVDGRPIEDVMALVKLFESICMQGNNLEVTWDAVTMIGIIAEFIPTWDRRERCKWEIKFEWIARGLPYVPVASSVVPSLTDTQGNIETQISDLEDIALEPPVPLEGSFASALQDGLDELRASADTLNAAITNFTSRVIGPIDAARRVASQLNQIIDDTLNTLGEFRGRTVSSIINLGGALEAPFGQVMQAAAYIEQISSRLRKLKNFAISQKLTILSRVNEESLTTHTVRSGEDLRTISFIYFKTQDNWKRIMTFNGLSSSYVETGSQILIPKPSSGGL